MLTRKSLSESLLLLLIALYLYTGTTKLIEYRKFRFALSESPLLQGYASLIGRILPFAEVALAIVIIIPKTRKIGLYISLGLLTFFTVYLFYMVNSGSNLPCSCGGVISKMSWNTHIYFNLFFILLNFYLLNIQKAIGKMISNKKSFAQNAG